MWIIVGVVIALVVVCAYGYSRLRRLSTQIGTFDCSYRSQSAGKTEHWKNGLCEYESDRLLWWRLYSLSHKPRFVWLREHFDLLGRTAFHEADAHNMYVVHCEYKGVPFELVMSTEAYHGLSSWVESAPPNHRGYVF